jgi:hypothetical protein
MEDSYDIKAFNSTLRLTFQPSGNGVVLKATTTAEAANIRKDERPEAAERVEKEEARGESRTHFPGPSGGTGALGQRNREGNPERQHLNPYTCKSMLSRNL